MRKSILKFSIIATVFSMMVYTNGLGVWHRIDGPYGGIVHALKINPGNPSVVYVGTQGGGIFRSIDGGETWSLSRNGLEYDWVHQIDVDPIDPNVVFAATSRYRKGNIGDVLRSSDGGETWSSTGLAGSTWFGVHVLRNDHQRIIAAGNAGIYLSTDGGFSWSQKSGAIATYISGDPSNPDHVYIGSMDTRIYHSFDGGETWEDIYVAQVFLGSISSVAVDCEDSNLIYCAVHAPFSLEGTGVYRSTDAGETWNEVIGTNASVVKTDPNVSGRVWALAHEFWYSVYSESFILKSTDSGDTWIVYNQFDDFPLTQSYAAKAYAIDINPLESDMVYVGLYYPGVIRTLDGGNTWEEINTQLSSAPVNCIAVHPSQPRIIYAGGYAAGLWKTTNAGDQWLAASDGITDSLHMTAELVINPDDPQELFAATMSNGLFRSSDGGLQWDPSLLGIRTNIYAVAINPHNTAEIWAAAGGIGGDEYRGLWKSNDDGDSWQKVLDGIEVASVAVSPQYPQVIYAGTGVPGFPGIYVSTNGGTTWLRRYTGSQFGFDVRDIAVSPADPMKIYAMGDLGVLKSTNGGRTWNYIDQLPGDGVPIDRVIPDPGLPDVVYAAVHDDDVFYMSFDDGETWRSDGAGLWQGGSLIMNLFSGPLPLHVIKKGRFRVFYLGTDGDGLYANVMRIE